MHNYKQIGGNRRSLPSSVKLKSGLVTGDFHKFSEAEHNAEGWYKCEQAPQLTDNQKLGEDILGEDNVWRHTIIDIPAIVLTQDAIDAKALDDLDRSRRMMLATPWQIRKALNQTGKREMIESAVLSSDEDTQDGWKYATSFERNNQLFIALCQTLGLSDSEIDDLFILAGSL